MNRDQERRWILRPRNIRKLWWLFCLVLAMTVLAQALIPIHAEFGVDGWFGFSAYFGFLSCMAMVVFARLIGGVLKRPDDYYDDKDV